MYNLKLYLKSKYFKISILTIIILTGINIFLYIKNTNILGSWVSGANKFAFWNYVMHYSYGSVLMFLSPIIICISSVYSFYSKSKGSVLKNELLKKPYSDVIIKEIFESYLKAMLPFLLVSILVFLIGSLLLPSDIPNRVADQYKTFDYLSAGTPYMFWFLSNVALILYTVFITNISYIVLYVVKKFEAVIIATAITVNVANFIVGNISILVAKILSSQYLLDYAYQINLFEGYYVQSTAQRAIAHTSIFILVTFVIMYFLYHDKEKVVRHFE